MAEVTVTELATTVGASVDRLLMQMKEAGLSHDSAEATVSDDEKQTLLGYLKGLHGENSGEPKKITLRRKTVSTLRSGNRKTVNIEVRKKRTYIKRSDEELQTQVDLEAETKAREEAELAAQQQAELEAQAALEAAAEAVLAEEPTPEAAAPVARRSSGTDNVEEQRIAAISNRRKAEEEVRQAVAQKAQEKLDEEARKASEAASVLASEEAKKVGKTTKQAPIVATEPVQDKARRHDKPNDDEDKLARKAKKPLGKAGKKKPRLQLDDGDDRFGKNRLKASRKALKMDNKHTFKRPVEKKTFEVAIPEELTVGDLAGKMALKSGVVIKCLMKLGVMANVNQVIDQETAFLVVEELGHQPVAAVANTVEDQLARQFEDIESVNDGEARAPIVTVMGHVDHGKTSLLDYIRKSRVASAEAGGITQHIGAYHVDTPKGMITFLDTPGHAAFTAMRARGAQSTDVIILVVAADDGVMPQTEEAIQHARAAGVPLIIAINKIDKESADSEKVTNELSAAGVIPESWGGDTQFIEVSAQTGVGIDDLLEAVLLQAELLELKASSSIPAKGVIIESRLEKGRGAVATVLVQAGKLKKGDLVLAGESLGRIRAMSDQAGKTVTDAGPSIPVEILGLDAPPAAGDEFLVVSDERKAKQLAEFRQNRVRDEAAALKKSAKLENMFATFEGGEEKSRLPIVVKADVRGSLEAILAALHEMGNEEIGRASCRERV